jgi:hypothetical protein
MSAEHQPDLARVAPYWDWWGTIVHEGTPGAIAVTRWSA